MDYEINSSTIAIVPLDNKITKIYEEETEYIINKSANSIIKENCEFYGSSYEGRCVGTKVLTGIKTKYPIIIEESRNIIFFPTSSIRNKQSTWIALNKIKNIIKDEYNSKVEFKNNKKINKDKKGKYYDPLYEYEKRTSLPEKFKEVSINVFKILKDAIGKDLNHFAMPVTLNEPLSMLQKLCEKFQYADLLNKAAKEPNPHLRLAYVATFNIAGITTNIHRAKKVFNPLLFETYEYVDNKLNYRFFAEQVSHHPAISAYYAEGDGWNLYSNSNSKINISITGYAEIQNLEKTYLNFTNFSEEITFSKPASKVRNILTDPILDICKSFWVKNSDGDECIVNLVPYTGNNKIGEMNGEVKDNEGNIVYKIEGNWCEKIKIINMKNIQEKVIWEIIKSKEWNTPCS